MITLIWHLHLPYQTYYITVTVLYHAVLQTDLGEVCGVAPSSTDVDLLPQSYPWHVEVGGIDFTGGDSIQLSQTFPQVSPIQGKLKHSIIR